MNTYTYPMQSAPEIRRQLFKLVPIFILVALGPLAMFYAVMPQLVLWMAGAFLIVLIVGVSLGIYNRARTRLTIEADQLTLDRPGKPPVTIGRSEIASITEEHDRGITVTSQHSDSTISIPNQLAEYQAIRTELLTWHPITPAPVDAKISLTPILSLIALSTVSAIGAFVFHIRFFFYLFFASFLIFAALGFVANSKRKDQPGPKKKMGRIEQAILVLVGLYLAHKFLVAYVF